MLNAVSTNELREEEDEEEEKTGGFPGQSVNDYLKAISPQYEDPLGGWVWQDIKLFMLPLHIAAACF